MTLSTGNSEELISADLNSLLVDEFAGIVKAAQRSDFYEAADIDTDSEGESLDKEVNQRDAAPKRSGSDRHDAKDHGSRSKNTRMPRKCSSAISGGTRKSNRRSPNKVESSSSRRSRRIRDKEEEGEKEEDGTTTTEIDIYEFQSNP